VNRPFFREKCQKKRNICVKLNNNIKLDIIFGLITLTFFWTLRLKFVKLEKI